MCFDERNTERRGRLFPARRKFVRTRCRRRRKRVLALSDISLLLLAFLPADGLGRIFDALALVGFGRSVGADLGRNLADALTVGTADGDQGRPLAGDLDVAGNRIGDVMTITELQIETIALNGSTIPDTIDFEGDRKPLRYPGDHVVYQRTRRSPHRTRLLCLAFRHNRYRTIGDRGGDLIADDEAQGAE